jgi:hypothetical protein
MRSPKSSASASADRHAYIPPGVGQAISKQMQQSLPAHLKKYAGSNPPAYIPEHVEKAITQHMQKKLPGHMKQYAGAYVQQNIVAPSFAKKSSPMAAPNPAKNSQASHPPEQNYTSMEINLKDNAHSPAISQPDQPIATQSDNDSSQEQDAAPITKSPGGTTDPNYNFIFNDQKSKRRFNFKLPGTSSPIKMALLIVGAGAILGVLIIVLSSVLGPKGLNTKQLTDTIARAQEISRVSDIVTRQSRDLNTVNLATTTSTTLTSEQVGLLSTLAKNHKKVLVKDFSVYFDKRTDAEIQTASQNNRLSEYYYSYLKKNLSDYQSSIKTAYGGTGSTGLKNILNSYSISNATILKTQQLAVQP